MTGYAEAKDLYWQPGWRGILQLNPGTKYPPPQGFTGHDGADPSYPDICTWADEHPDGNLALRLPDDIIGIDVDAYGAKTGATTLAEAENRWGKLPPTHRSTSRADGVSGIKLFRVPPGTVLRDRIEFGDLGVGDIDVVQHHHRYVMCWPSIHPEGRQYRWIAEIDGTEVDYVPNPDDLPDLPDNWLDVLRVTNDGADLGGDQDGYDVAETFTEGRPSARVSRLLGEALADLHEGRNRHDTTCGHVLAPLRCGKDGEPGVMLALKTLRTAFITAVTADGSRPRDEAGKEFRRMVRGPRSAGRAAARPTRSRRQDEAGAGAAA
jgi:hypothetical protein